MMILFAALTQGIIIFPFIGDEFMHYSVFAKAVQHPVDRHSVHLSFYALLENVLAEG